MSTEKGYVKLSTNNCLGYILGDFFSQTRPVTLFILAIQKRTLCNPGFGNLHPNHTLHFQHFSLKMEGPINSIRQSIRRYLKN
jgi:hypothetical protein